MDYKLISTTLNVQLKGVEDLDSLSAGLRLAIISLKEEFKLHDAHFDSLQFEFDCLKLTKFSDGGKALGRRASYMMA